MTSLKLFLKGIKCFMNLIIMKRLSKYLMYLLMVYGMITCNNSDKKLPNTTSNQIQFSGQQLYTIDNSGISILWTAHKFTNKVDVSGTFNTYIFESKKTSGTVENILNKSKLSIPTATVNSSNPIRDFKLDTYFFKAFNTSKIIGTITKAKENEGIIDLKMNHTSKKIPFTYAIEKDTIRLFTNLDLTYWKGEEALKTLNTECYELHKGTDGISKLWTDVDVVIKIPAHKTLIIN
ncbi:YceI-like domain-containing protein [Winogradskyella pacifica]|uniref:YceI-like domain-containing protein n=2 Tax=Winogradskyella pacifica TaxID=664642 RepID=A0A3D9LNV1_9FLAO|nr:YceI-like domain-containing protein [Winogradskyella pacifica]